MKLLKKLRLINWHYFQNSITDFGKINFLTGENAAGKSTIIDAMQVVLLGDTVGRSFNKAANEKSGRTLKGYLRGEIGDNDDGSTKYLRSGRFTSYVALEFYDDVMEQPFTVGIVFDVFDDGSESHRFFVLESSFPENDFLQNRIPMSQKQLSEYFAQNYQPNQYMFCDSNAHYQSVLKEKFGNLKDKYFTLFKKAVSFTPITNIEQFITDYVCDVPNEINIESMKANISSYERLKLEAADMELKIKSLEEISKLYEEILSKRNEQTLASYISNRISFQLSLERIKKLQNDITSNETRINEIKDTLVQIDNDIADLNNQKETLILHKFSSDNYKLSLELKKSYDEAKKRVDQIEKNVDVLYNNISTYARNFSESSNKISLLCQEIISNSENEDLQSTCKELILEGEHLNRVIEKIKANLTSRDDISKEIFEEFSKALNDFKNKCGEVYGVLKNTLGRLLTNISNRKQQLFESNSGKSYDYEFLLVKNQLAHALEDYYHKKVEVSVYADLVDIKSQKWVKAIEGFIASQKLNLFVDKEYYETANKILPEILRRNKYYRTGLVDSEKLYQQNFVCDNNSVAEEIETDHQGARDYTNFLLGKIYKCETFAEARESGRGLCPNCTGYRNFASFVIPESNYRYLVIGKKISNETKAKRKEEIEIEMRGIEALRSLVDQLAYASRLDVMSNNEQEICLKQLDEGQLLPSLKANLDKYYKELEDGSSFDIQNTDNKINKINDDIEDLNNQKSTLLQEQGRLSSAIDTINQERIPAEIEASNKLMEEIKANFDAEWIENVGKVAFDQELQESNSLSDIRLKYDNKYMQAQNKMKTLYSHFNELRKDYIVTHKLSYDITREDNDDFERELISLRDVKLPQYLAKIEDARQKATKEFKDDFIFKLKTSIESARTQIDELNEALKDAKFGQDSYEFTIQPNPQYIDYYNMITDELLLEVGADEDAFMAKHKDIMDNLFRMISDDGNSKDKSSAIAQNIEKFTDYRTYLLFDLKVKKPDNRVYSLSRNIKKASGGETQTPFYISILASFSQLYRVKANKSISNCTRLVVFDEAFSKMDRNRIVESIRILKEFDLQVILSAPPEKVNDISEIVDRTLVVTRKNNCSFIDPYQIKR